MPIALEGFNQKVSKGNALSLYLSTRNIQQLDDRMDQQLEVVIHKNGSLSSADLMISLVGRLVIDAGLQFVERTVYLCEENVLNLSGSVFKLMDDSDEGYYRILVNMPGNLPDSLTMTPMTSGRLCLGYGLTWFIAASLVEKPQGYYSPRFRRVAKVIMSFFKNTLYHSPSTKEPLAVESSSRGILESSARLTVCGKLDKPSYSLVHDRAMNLMLEFTGSTGSIKSIRINCKQLINIQLSNHQDPIRIKNTWLKKEHPQANLIEIPLTDLQQQIYHAGGCYQLGLYSLSKTEMKWELAQSSTQFPIGLSGLVYLKVEYYMNVHVVLGWTRRNLVLRIPFEIFHHFKGSNAVSPQQQKPEISIPNFSAEESASEFQMLNWMQDLGEAKTLYKVGIREVEELQLASRTCIRPSPDKFISYLREMTSHLSHLKPCLIKFLQQPPQSTAARDLARSVLKVLEAHSLAVFYSEIERSQREALLREGYEFLNDLKCLLFSSSDGGDHYYGDDDNDESGLFYDNEIPLRASARIQNRLIAILELYPPLHDLIKFLVSGGEESYYHQRNSLLPKTDVNRFYVREYLEQSGWNLGFLPPIRLPTELKLALIDKTPEERLDFLISFRED